MEPWKEKISKGMELIIEGCQENESWLNCKKCPFMEVCDIITENAGNYDYIVDNSEYLLFTPDVWKEHGVFDKKEEK